MRATITLGAAATILTCTALAHAGDNGVLSPGVVISGFWSPGSGPQLGVGGEVSYTYYRGSFYRGDLGVGGYANAQWLFARGDAEGRARIALGAQAAKYVVTGALAGVALETADSRSPATVGVEAAPYFSLGIISIWGGVTIPLSSAFAPGRGWQMFLSMAAKAPITVHGRDAYKDITLGSGRPLRDGRGTPRIPSTHYANASGDDAIACRAYLSEERAAVWARDAALERASVAAFERLATELATLGAPSSLSERALRAAREERGHTTLCAAIASLYAGRELVVDDVTATPRAIDVLELAVETFVDGCIGEGAAASSARRAARQADLPLVARALRRIAREEASHAKLAGDIVAWCLAVDVRALPALLRVAADLAEREPIARRWQRRLQALAVREAEQHRLGA